MKIKKLKDCSKLEIAQGFVLVAQATLIVGCLIALAIHFAKEGF